MFILMLMQFVIIIYVKRTRYFFHMCMYKQLQAEACMYVRNYFTCSFEENFFN